jgi:hypothetical protein
MLEATQPETALASTDAPTAQPVDANPSTEAVDFYCDPASPSEGEQAEGGEAIEGNAEGEEQQPEPIDAPASWAKDAKEQFATLPREAQEIIAKRERERDVEVRRAQNSVQTARQQAEREAMSHVQRLREDTARQLAQYAHQFSAPEPDIRLLQSSDPQHHAIYMQQERDYRLASAQQQQLSQQAQEAQREADAIAQQQHHAEVQAEHQALVEAIPEWSDPSQRANLIAELEPIGAELGYSPELMAQAGATDILALRTALSWKRDADELRSLKNKAKMVPVRAAKQIPPAGRVAAPSGQTAPVSTAAQLYPEDVRR